MRVEPRRRGRGTYAAGRQCAGGVQEGALGATGTHRAAGSAACRPAASVVPSRPRCPRLPSFSSPFFVVTGPSPIDVRGRELVVDEQADLEGSCRLRELEAEEGLPAVSFSASCTASPSDILIWQGALDRVEPARGRCPCAWSRAPASMLFFGCSRRRPRAREAGDGGDARAPGSVAEILHVLCVLLFFTGVRSGRARHFAPRDLRHRGSAGWREPLPPGLLAGPVTILPPFDGWPAPRPSGDVAHLVRVPACHGGLRVRVPSSRFRRPAPLPPGKGARASLPPRYPLPGVRMTRLSVLPRRD